MAFRIVTNRKGNGVVLHATANSTIALANLAVDVGEVVNSATITQAFWGAETPGSWRVARGSNNVLVLDSTSYNDFAGNGMSLALDKTADFSVTLSGTANGFIMLEVQKDSTIANTAYPGGE